MESAKAAWKAARFATKVLIAIAVFLVLFVAVMVWSFIVTGGEEQSQLIESVFTVVLKRIVEKIFSETDKEVNPRDL